MGTANPREGATLLEGETLPEGSFVAFDPPAQEGECAEVHDARCSELLSYDDKPDRSSNAVA
jgi:hypothetical protein